jgi:hypothetical protein
MCRDGLHLVELDVMVFPEARMDELERLDEIPVLVDGVDDRMRDRLILIAHMGQVDLPQQVLREALPRRPLVLVHVTAFGIRAGSGGWGGVVNIIPTAVYRQFLGDFLAGGGGLGGFRHRLGRGTVLAIAADLVLGAGIVGTPHLALDIGVRLRVAALEGLQHRVALQGFLDLGLQFQRGELQQAYGLLQLGRHGEALAKTQLDRGFQHWVSGVTGMIGQGLDSTSHVRRMTGEWAFRPACRLHGHIGSIIGVGTKNGIRVTGGGEPHRVLGPMDDPSHDDRSPHGRQSRKCSPR